MARPSSRAPLSNLTQRLLSAAVGLPILGLLIWQGGIWTGALAVAVTVLALYEALTLIRRAGWEPMVPEGTAWGGALVAIVAVRPDLLWSIVPAGGLAVLAAAFIRRRSAAAIGAWTFTAAAAVYVALPLASAVALRFSEAGLQWLLLAVLSAFATDTGAFAVGKLIGRHRMAPSISPGKTWEGAAGGLAAGIAATVALLVLLVPVTFIPWAAVGLGVSIGVIAQAGDLVESKLKRLAGAKESGHLIPGHGGLLDRLDSLVLVFPVVYYASRVWPA